MARSKRTLILLAASLLGCAAGGDGDGATSTAAAAGTGGAATGGAGGGGPTCSDGSANGDETDVDCGGPDCTPCDDGAGCEDDDDCASKVCADSVCAQPACDDGVLNGAETSKDCGGGCPACPVCFECQADTDCDTGLCQANLCAPTITVVSAVYAANCSAPTPVPTIVAACDKKQTCAYLFNYTVDIGFDPAYGCYKDLKVDWTCTGGMTTKTFYEACAPCDPQNTPTMINLELDCDPCLGIGKPPA